MWSGPTDLKHTSGLWVYHSVFGWSIYPVKKGLVTITADITSCSRVTWLEWLHLPLLVFYRTTAERMSFSRISETRHPILWNRLNQPVE